MINTRRKRHVLVKKGTDGSGSSTRNPRPRKRAGKRAHTCPPSDPRYLLTFPLSHHHFAPFGPNKTGKAFVKIKRKKKRVKREKKLGKEIERIKWGFPHFPFKKLKSFSDSIPASSHNGRDKSYTKKAVKKLGM